MGEWIDLSLLLALVAVIGAWLGLSRARERAVEEVRRQCLRHGLQLLDEMSIPGFEVATARTYEPVRRFLSRYEAKVGPINGAR